MFTFLKSPIKVGSRKAGKQESRKGKRNFESLKVGDYFSDSWSKGSFGLLYKRK